MLDTSVLVAAWRSRAGASYELVSAVIEGDLDVALSVPLVLEYESALLRNCSRGQRASDVAEDAILSSVYDRQKLPSVIRLIETTQPESIPEKIAAFAAPFFQPTVGIAAAAALLVGLLVGAIIF